MIQVKLEMHYDRRMFLPMINLKNLLVGMMTKDDQSEKGMQEDGGRQCMTDKGDHRSVQHGGSVVLPKHVELFSRKRDSNIQSRKRNAKWDSRRKPKRNKVCAQQPNKASPQFKAGVGVGCVEVALRRFRAAGDNNAEETTFRMHKLDRVGNYNISRQYPKHNEPPGCVPETKKIIQVIRKRTARHTKYQSAEVVVSGQPNKSRIIKMLFVHSTMNLVRAIEVSSPDLVKCNSNRTFRRRANLKHEEKKLPTKHTDCKKSIIKHT